MIRWGMVIDLEKCIGCNSCSTVCREVYGPRSNWRVVHDLGIYSEGEDIRLSIPTSCMHCEHAPCVEVCPTTASYIRDDGIVALDYDKCVGCGYCIMACPFDARVLSPMGKITNRPDSNNSIYSEISTKCTFCTRKIDEGIHNGKQPGHDKEATPDCVVTCSADALTFGDLRDPASNVSNLLRQNKWHQVNADLQTKPSVYYLLPLNSHK